MKDKKIYIINGSGGVGKDTFVKIISENTSLNILNYSSVDKIKIIAKEIGWMGTKTEKDRKFLSDLKMLCSEYNDMPLKCVVDEIVKFMFGDYYDVMFIHVREPEEIEKLKSIFNVKTILIIRNSIKHIESNAADKNVFNYKYDFTINNNGTLKFSVFYHSLYLCDNRSKTA